MKVIVVIFILLGAFSANGQFGQSDTVWLVNGYRKLEPYQNKLKPDFSLDARRTLFQKKWVAIMGFTGGVEYRRIHRFGLGVYFLNTRVFDRNFQFDIETEKVEYEFKYTSIYYERTLFFNKKWETGGTLHLGGGNINVLYQNPENRNERLSFAHLGFSTMEVSAYGEYHILYWLGVSAGIGYRQLMGVQKDVRKDFSTPIFVVNVQLKLFKLAKSYFDEDVKNEY